MFYAAAEYIAHNGSYFYGAAEPFAVEARLSFFCWSRLFNHTSTPHISVIYIDYLCGYFIIFWTASQLCHVTRSVLSSHRSSFYQRCKIDRIIILPIVNTKHLYNIWTMLDQRGRRLAVVVQMLYKCFVFAGFMSTAFSDSFIGK